jgi:hypothetical protein
VILSFILESPVLLLNSSSLLKVISSPFIYFFISDEISDDGFAEFLSLSTFIFFPDVPVPVEFPPVFSEPLLSFLSALTFETPPWFCLGSVSLGDVFGPSFAVEFTLPFSPSGSFKI